jgi:hypothetical protein
MSAKIYNVNAVHYIRKPGSPKELVAQRKQYRMLLVDCDPFQISQEIAKQLPDGCRIENVQQEEIVIPPCAFVLSVTEQIP